MTATRLARLRSVAGSVSRETFDLLLAFEAEFSRWASRINLSAPSTRETIWERHILDSAQLVPLAPLASRWLDLGTGGGFPGAIVAILLAEQKGRHVDLIESNGKKAAFLKTTLAKLHIPATVHASRIGDVQVGLPDVVTARALAPLPSLLVLSSRWLGHGAPGLFHKGRGYRAEIEESRDDWHFDLIEHRSAVADDSVILEVSRLRKR